MTDPIRIKTLDATKGWGRGRVYDSIAETIGHTPLVRLSRMTKSANANADVLLKLEFFNPLSSVKDRIGVAMIDVLEAEGRIAPGKTVLIEPTSGNTGVGLAFVAASRGYRLILVMPDTMSIERRKILAHLGAELVLTPGAKGMPGALERAQELIATTPDAIEPGQFVNPANPMVHEKTTAEEIWTQTGGRIDGFVSAVGSGGTLGGVSLGLKAKRRDIQIALADVPGAALHSYYTSGVLKAEGSSITEGIGQGRVTRNLEGVVVDRSYMIPDAESVAIVFGLLTEEGLCMGGSTGVNVAGAIRLAREMGPGHTIVTLLCDYGTRYQSKLFNPEFLRAKGLPVPTWLAAPRQDVPSVFAVPGAA